MKAHDVIDVFAVSNWTSEYRIPERYGTPRKSIPSPCLSVAHTVGGGDILDAPVAGALCSAVVVVSVFECPARSDPHLNGTIGSAVVELCGSCISIMRKIRH